MPDWERRILKNYVQHNVEFPEHEWSTNYVGTRNKWEMQGTFRLLGALMVCLGLDTVWWEF